MYNRQSSNDWDETGIGRQTPTGTREAGCGTENCRGKIEFDLFYLGSGRTEKEQEKKDRKGK